MTMHLNSGVEKVDKNLLKKSWAGILREDSTGKLGENILRSGSESDPQMVLSKAAELFFNKTEQA
ncbi:MAG: hypothetical protein ABIH00_01480 [Armatimonadota bacterium]